MLQGCKNCRATIQPSYCLESVQFLRIAGHPFIHGCHCSCLRFVSWCEVSTTSTAMRTWQLRATGWLNEVAYGMTNESQVSLFSLPILKLRQPTCSSYFTSSVRASTSTNTSSAKQTLFAALKMIEHASQHYTQASYLFFVGEKSQEYKNIATLFDNVIPKQFVGLSQQFLQPSIQVTLTNLRL